MLKNLLDRLKQPLLDRRADGDGRKPSLAALLGLVTVATLLPPLIIGVWLLSRTVDEQRREDVHQLTHMAATLSAALDREVRGWQETIEVVGLSPPLVAGDIAGFAAWARRAAPRAGGVIVLIDRDGRLLVNTQTERRELPETAHKPLIDRVLATGKPAVGSIRVGAVSGRLSFLVAAPVTVDGAVRYVVGLSPGLDKIEQILAGHALQQGWLASIIDARGIIAARSHMNAEFQGRSATPDFLARTTASSGTIESTDLEGRRSITAYNVSPVSGWRAVAWSPLAVLDAPSRRAALAGLALLAAALLLSASTALLASHVIRRPVAVLLDGANRMARGEAVTLEPTPMRETDAIGTALTAASRAIAERQAALVASEARIRHIANATPAMLWTATPGGFIWASERWYDYTGLAHNDVERGFGAAIHPDDRARTRALWRKALASGSDVTTEARLKGRDGTWRWFQTHAIAERDGEGRVVMWYGSTTDIDDLKRTASSLAQSEARLRLAQEIAGIATFEWRLASDRLSWSHTPGEIAALLPGTAGDSGEAPGRATLAALFARVPLEDAHRLEAAHDGVLARGGTFVDEVPLVLTDGSLTWLHVRGEVFCDASGAPTRVIAVARDITRRKRAEIETARFATVADSSSEAIIGTDPGGRIEVWNKAAEQLYGWTAEEVRGQPISILDTDERPGEAMALIGRVVAGATIGPLDAKRRHKDGSTVEVNVSIAPVRDPSGRVVAVSASAHDVAELKRQERQMRFIMRELSHRSKNLLAVVQAMARQTARTSRGIEDFQRRFGERVDALARSHDLLVAQEWQGASLADLVQSQLLPFVGRERTRIAIEGPPLLLRPEAAQNIGMALHELATNAAKHGALSTPDGRIRVTWRTDEDATLAALPDAAPCPRLVLEWREVGGPAAAEPTNRGFGRDVLERLVPSALEAEATLAWKPEGVIWRFSAPLAAVVAEDETLARAGARDNRFDIGTRTRALRDLYRLWSEARGGERLPRASTLDGEAFMADPSHFAVACAPGRPARLTLVSVGSALAQALGLATGADASDATSPPVAALLAEAGQCLRRAEATANPCYRRMRLVAADGRPVMFETMMAPFSEDGVAISCLIGAAVAEPPEPAA